MDELTVNDLGVDSALDLAVSREALTKSIEKEITAVKLSDESATELSEVRERLIKELEKQGPVIDYAKDLSEQQLALIDSLKRQTQSAESVSKANNEQASAITKQTAGIVKVSNQSTQQFKKQSLLGNIAGKALQSFTGSITDTLSGVLDDLPGIQQAKQVSSFTKSVMPTKAKEKPAKRIQSVSKRDRLLSATVAPEKAKNAPESFTDTLKRRDEQGSGRNGRVMIKHLTEIEKTTGLILKEVKSSTVIGFVMKAMMASAVMGLSRLLLGLPATLAASLAKTIADKIRPQPKAGGKKPDPAKPEPKRSDPKPKTDPSKADPKKSDPKPKTDPTKVDPKKSDSKPKIESKPQPKIEAGAKSDIPKPEPTKPTSSPKPSSPTGGITKADKIKEGTKAAVQGAKTLATIFIKHPWIIAAGMKAEEIYTDTVESLDGTRVKDINKGFQEWENKRKPTPEPVKMDRGESSAAEQGIQISKELDKKAEERDKAIMKTQEIMAQSISSSNATINQTNVTNVSGGGGSSGSYITPFGNEYQTPSQKGSMIQR
ncbi:TPA: hypothetical protein ACSP3M_004016 [Aeromonas veronii]